MTTTRTSLVVFFLGVLYVLWFPFQAGQEAKDSQATRKDCALNSANLAEVSGTVRIAGSGYFFVADGKWHNLMLRCNPSAGRRGCETASPQQKTLEKHAGKPAVARLCAGEIVQFQINDEWYSR